MSKNLSLSFTSKDGYRKSIMTNNIDKSRVFLENAIDISNHNKAFLEEINIANQNFEFSRKYTSIEVLNSQPTTFDNRRSVYDDNRLDNKIVKISDEISSNLLKSRIVINQDEIYSINLESSIISPSSTYQYNNSSTYSDMYTIPSNLFVPSMNRSISPSSTFAQQFISSFQSYETTINEEEKQILNSSLIKDSNKKENKSAYVGDNGIMMPDINMTEIEMFDNWYLYVFLSVFQ